LLDGLLRDHPEDIAARLALAKLQIDVGGLYWRSGESRLSRAEFEQARDVLERLIHETPSSSTLKAELAGVYHNLGFGDREVGAPAGSSFEKARALRAELVRTHPNIPEFQSGLASTVFQLGYLRLSSGDVAGALACFEEARTAQERLAQLHPAMSDYSHGLALTLVNLAEAHRAASKLAEAVRLYEQGRDRFAALVQANGSVTQYRSDLAGTWERLGSLHRAMKDYPAALGAFEQARSAQAELVRDHPDQPKLHSMLGATCNNLGLVLLDLGRLDDALTAFAEAVAHQRQAFDRAPTVAQYRRFLSHHYVNVANTQRRLSRPAEAAAAAIERQKLWPDDAAELVTVAIDLAQCAGLVGREKAALSAAEQAERQGYCDQAVGALRQAVTRGFRDATKLETEQDLEPLRDRSDFRQLIAELKAGRQPLPK
jgi:tetratricopeptide (TPR) repeat protein